MKLLVTGGAGFIGSNFIRHILARHKSAQIINFDKLTYAGNLENLAEIANHPRYLFVRGDIADPLAVGSALAQGFDAVVNFAAETHVDRSIEDSAPFLRTNVLGTQVLLEAARHARIPLLVQISTDEVYGSAAPGQSFREDANLNPGSPYAASKAAADLLVHCYGNTYGLPAIIMRCTNNYGPYQFPEKIIPLVVANALEEKPVPVYGDGLHERDWLFVTDYCCAIEAVLERGAPRRIYNVSSGTPQPNLAVVRTILRLLGKPESLIRFLEDRPGHDRRYSLDSGTIQKELNWQPMVSFEEGIQRTIEWYRANRGWLARARSGEYHAYYVRQYERREEGLKAVHR